MALITTTQNFVVSTALSATAAVSVTAAVVITPRGLPVGAIDAVGAGTPRILSYPTSSLVGPLTYEMNPQVWTNMGAAPFIRPLYASQRTLTKTATVQFTGDITDLEVTETWMGGGSRVAMSLSFFAALWDYFQNVPDVTSAGFITWEPRDLNSNVYAVFLTDLSVGGSEVVTLDNLYRTSPAWVHETVTLRMRLISDDTSSAPEQGDDDEVDE